jgi:hypothetical protein
MKQKRYKRGARITFNRANKTNNYSCRCTIMQVVKWLQKIFFRREKIFNWQEVSVSGNISAYLKKEKLDMYSQWEFSKCASSGASQLSCLSSSTILFPQGCNISRELQVGWAADETKKNGVVSVDK